MEGKDPKHSPFIEKMKQQLRERGIDPDEIVKQKPLFYQAAEHEAKRLGITPEEVLAADLEALKNCEFPKPDCLMPTEILFLAGPLADCNAEYYQQAKLHLEKCEFCQGLMAMMGKSIP